MAGWGGGAARPEVRRFVRPAWGGAKVGLAARGRLAARRGGRPVGPCGTKAGWAFSRGADRASGGPREADLGADPRSGRCGVGGQEREGGAAAQVAGERWRLHKNVLWSLHKNVFWALLRFVLDQVRKTYEKMGKRQGVVFCKLDLGFLWL